MSEANPNLRKARNVTVLLGMLLLTIVFMAAWKQRHPVSDKALEPVAERTNTR
jgi:hypothetical protein